MKVINCNKNGTPDILASYKGQFYAFEVKTPTGRVAPIQTYQHEQIAQAGGVVSVVRSVDEVKEVLNG